MKQIRGESYHAWHLSSVIKESPSSYILPSFSIHGQCCSLTQLPDGSSYKPAGHWQSTTHPTGLSQISGYLWFKQVLLHSPHLSCSTLGGQHSSRFGHSSSSTYASTTEIKGKFVLVLFVYWMTHGYISIWNKATNLTFTFLSLY